MNHRLAGLVLLSFCWSHSLRADVVLPGLVPNLVCYYDFEHPVAGDPAREGDLGFSATDISLINGDVVMRVNDGAYAGSAHSLQTQQFNPDTNSNDDWKAGLYQTNGVVSLNAFSSVAGITLMGWVKPTGTNPNLNSVTPATNDFYNAVGLFGLLSGDSDGHGVRALLEVINVAGTLRLVALGRRLDGGNSLTLAATNDWHALIPNDVWTHLAATFDYDNGTMALYRNGTPLGASYTTTGDAWGVVGGIEPDLASASNPAGIKTGGSFPQNTVERNAFNGRFDDLMFFNKVLSAAEVQSQYARFPPAPPLLSCNSNNNEITLSWPLSGAGYLLEAKTNLAAGGWILVSDPPVTNGEALSVTLPITWTQHFFRLRRL